MGGKCEKCGYNKCLDALEFHHKDPSQKEFQICSSGGCASFERTLEEAKNANYFAQIAIEKNIGDKDMNKNKPSLGKVIFM